MKRDGGSAMPGMAILGCNDPTQVEIEERLGTIGGVYEDDPQIDVTVDNRDISITVASYGNGCVTAGPTEVSIDEMKVEIMPFDTVRFFQACTDNLRQFATSPASLSQTRNLYGDHPWLGRTFKHSRHVRT